MNSSRARRPAIFLTSAIYGAPGFAPDHPLGIERISSIMRLCDALDWLPPEQQRASPCATDAQLLRFHAEDYLEALRSAEAAGSASPEQRERFGIGGRENPIFPGLNVRAATGVGGSILAARLALQGYVSFHPAGGTHHGRPARASGFCYFNDPVFALLTLMDAGLRRVLYVDLDAHHCDGVQDALRDDVRVHTVSVHEENRWPFTGTAEDQGGGRSCNLPVPAGFNDAELELLMQQVILPFTRQLEPEALVLTCGADALAGDPLSRLALSNGALWDAVERLVALSPAAVVLGGGGYNPWTLARCWTGLWGRLSGRRVPAALPQTAVELLAGLSCELIDDEQIEPEWIHALADAPRRGPVRRAVRALAASAQRRIAAPARRRYRA